MQKPLTKRNDAKWDEIGEIRRNGRKSKTGM